MNSPGYAKGRGIPDGGWYAADVDLVAMEITDLSRVERFDQYRLVDMMVLKESQATIYVWATDEDEAMVRMRRHVDRCLGIGSTK